METRSPAHAGTFYPGDKRSLLAELDRLFDSARDVRVAGPVRGLLCPHAGYVYSGRVAATGYSLLRDSSIETVVLLGPTHRIPYAGIAVYDQGEWQTPLGPVRVDAEISGKFIERSGQAGARELHRQEHSLEVQLPFVQTVLPGARIVPLMLGHLDLEAILRAGDVLGEIFSENPTVSAVASSDLYHGASHEDGKKTDRRTLDLILRMDERVLFEALARGDAMACGGASLVLLTRACKHAGVGQATLLEYTNSTDEIGSDTGYTVGYASVAFSNGGKG
jgi:hypothetical protein